MVTSLMVLTDIFYEMLQLCEFDLKWLHKIVPQFGEDCISKFHNPSIILSQANQLIAIRRIGLIGQTHRVP